MDIPETRYATSEEAISIAYQTFEDVGEHELKGVPDRWHLCRVVD